MRIALVHMPWGALEIPSLALGIMRTVARRHGHEAEIRYANLDFVDWITGRTEFGPAEYRYYAESSYFQSAGDWVFSSALYDGEVRQGGYEHYLEFLAGGGADDAEIATTRALHRIAPEFIAELVDCIAVDEPDVVGFTTTFQQNTASLAAAKLLKQQCPGVRVVFGGANCDGPQGAALHRNFPFLDFVVRGEGEAAFPLLLEALAEGHTDLSAIPGLCWHSDGESRANSMAHTPLPPAVIAPPDYDGFIERLDVSAAVNWVEPKLVVRGEPPHEFIAEVLDLARRHQLLDFHVVDNILDMGYFDAVLRELAGSGYDLRLLFEVKANLRRHQFQLLGDSGAVQVQPGIESLSTNVLRLMDKGVTGCENVRALRDAQSAGVTASWNYLFGFPGESDQDYDSVIRQLPALHHLDPPVGVSHIVIERFGPYFDRPELGFAEVVPAAQYADIYRLPDKELADLAYLFSAPPRGISTELASELSAAIDTWSASFPVSRLSWADLGETIMLVSHRPGFAWSVLELKSPAERVLFRLLDQPRSVRTLAQRVDGGEAVVLPLLAHWQELGIVFIDAGMYLQIAVEARNQELLRPADQFGGQRLANVAD